MRSIYLQIIDHQSDNPFPVLATVARTEGSTPQKPGSSALFSDKGLVAGTVGGGVVEGRIQKVAAERSGSKRSGYFNFNLHNDISRKEEAICGGKISILVDASPEKNQEVFRKIGKSLAANTPGILVTFVTNASENDADIKRYWYDGSADHGIPGDLWPKVMNEASELLGAANPMNFREIGLSGKEDNLSSFVLMEPVLPPLQLVIAGAGHIGRSLAHTGSLLGFEVTVIDDRPEYACFENIPDANHVIVEDIGKAIKEL
jgi:xanthine dehydrogenase accessory factor